MAEREVAYEVRWWPAVVKFVYRNHRGEVALRSVAPARLWHGECEWHPGPQWLLDGYDVDRMNALRTFALKDVVSWEPGPLPALRLLCEALLENERLARLVIGAATSDYAAWWEDAIRRACEARGRGLPPPADVAAAMKAVGVTVHDVGGVCRQPTPEGRALDHLIVRSE